MNKIVEIPASWKIAHNNSEVKGTKSQHPSFTEMLKSFVDEVNNLQKDADDSIKKLMTGETTDIHQVMVAAEEASTSLELMIEIRNKILEAYRELMRIPV